MIDPKIQNFLRIVEIGSFTDAAEFLYISQAALSQQIQKLEREIGFALFDRHSRKAKLTAAGKQFYVQAAQIDRLCESALEQCRSIAQLEKENKTRLKAGCLDDHVFTVWTKLMELVPEEQCGIFPRPARYDSRLELYRALLRGDEDLAVLMENEELYRMGLAFHPITFIQEVCLMYSPTKELKDKEFLTLEDLLQNLLSFHFAPGHTLYEDELRRQLRQMRPSFRWSEPDDFFDTHREKGSGFLLVPSLQYTGDPAAAKPLCWNDGIRIGFVTRQNCTADTIRYIRQVQQAAKEHPELWQWKQK